MRAKKDSTPVVNPNTQFLLSAEVCLILRCSKRSLIRYYFGYTKSDGVWVRPVLSSVRRGGRILFAKSAVEAYLAKRTTVVG